MTTKSKKQLISSLNILQAIAETIRELGKVPSGELYSQLVERLDLQQYEQAIGILKRTGLVTETKSHLLIWNEGKTK